MDQRKLLECQNQGNQNQDNDQRKLNGKVGNPKKSSAGDARHECRSQREKRSGHHCNAFIRDQVLRKINMEEDRDTVA